MDLFNFEYKTIFSFFLTFIRLSIVLFLLPFFGGSSLPNQIKAALCLVLTFGLWPALSFPNPVLPAHPFSLTLMILGELILGVLLSLLTNFIFAAIQTGGTLISFQIGFSMVNAVDPLSGVSEAALSHFLYMTSLLVFLSINGHLLLLKALSSSFYLIPPGELLLNPEITKHIISLSGQIFLLAIKIAAPVIAAVFLADLALALVSKAAPQMNVLIIGFPVKIMLGFIFIGVLFALLATAMENFTSKLGLEFNQIFHFLTPIK